jgi:exodeoxyribonuclease VIII
MRIMLDLETFGNAPGAVIVAIGAVKFGAGILGDHFYARVDAESCVKAGLQMDVSTVMWWMAQEDKARFEVCEPGRPLPDVLAHFSEWIGTETDNVEMWGNGSDFDNAILAQAYRVCEMPLPWKFWNNRCYRTMKAHYAHVKPEKKNGHHALGDAINQASHLMKIWPAL